MLRGLLVLVALVAAAAGGLVGLQAAPDVWSALAGAGIVATPTCNDVIHLNVSASCLRPVSMEVAALATATLFAAAAGFVTWRILRAAAARLPRDATG